MRHANYEMIVAKAANMDLVAFCDGPYGKSWHKVDSNWPFFSDDFHYFLCLPQHKEACLHWLNGGEIQDYYNGEWTKIKCHNGSPDWNEPDQLFMNEEFHLRITPKKEKRWIAFNKSNENVYGTFDTEEECRTYWPTLPVIEIEIEV